MLKAVTSLHAFQHLRERADLLFVEESRDSEVFTGEAAVIGWSRGAIFFECGSLLVCFRPHDLFSIDILSAEVQWALSFR